jgi:hydrophobic/amphiphilic exporter-1 (mainly G- bacteria), HAE1 family
MFISDFAIKRPLITIVSMVALAVFGLIALMRLQTDEFPDVAEPVVFTAIIYPGASPDQVERELLDPIEEAIQGISGVDKVFGEARDGYAQIVTVFLYEKDLKEATQDIRDGISAIRNDLPPEMEEPIIKRFSPNDFPIVQIAVNSSTMSPAELTRVADPLMTREMRSVAGVAQVDIVGKVERELTVQLKPEALQAANVSIGEVVQALQAQNLAVPVGRLNGDLDERTIRLKGRLDGPADFAQMIVAERGGTVVRLGQVADVRDGTEEQRSLALFNGKEAVGIEITKSKGYSTTEVSDKIRAKVAELQKKVPPGVQIEIVRDAGVRVATAVRNVQEALIEGALLTVLVVFLFLNSWRSTVITGVALPISVLASFIAVWALGFKLETMSLLGLSLAIGILIDDAIVVRENIVRHVEMGKDHYRAAREGTDEIGLAVAATTFSIVAVFVPIGFMYGVAGEWFRPFALTIACSVLVSLFVSFSLDPMLSAYWKDPHRTEEEKWWITRKLDQFNHWFNRQATNYRKVIAWALDHRWTMVAIAAGTFFAALAMPALGLVGGGFFPVSDNSEINVVVETPPGSNLGYLRLKTEEVLRATTKHPEVKYTYATLGGGQSGTVDVGNIYVKLSKRHERSRSAEDLATAIRREAGLVAGVTASVFTNATFGNQKQISLQVRGDDPQEIERAAEQIFAAAKTVPGAADVSISTKGQKPELDIQMNRGLAGSLGITVGQVAQALRPAFAGIDAGDWVDPSGETRDVVVRLTPGARERVQDLAKLPILFRDPNGLPATVPLEQVATIRQSTGPAQINHLDGDRVVTVDANTAGAPLSAVTAGITSKIDSLRLPPSVRVTQGGDVESQNEVFGRIIIALLTAVMLMYLILVVQFGSFIDPLAILVSVPLSMIGVMLALALTGNTMNLMSMIGIILLAGIVAKNAILLIDFAKWAREEQGLPLREALIEAGAIRLRPILMTTFALIAGMLPIAIGSGEGSQFRAPMGVAVIGGVVTSTVLTLLVIPTVYEIMDSWRARVSRLVGLNPPQTAEHKVMGVPAAAAGD